MGLFTTERAVSSRSYIFDGAGGMRDQLEQTILEILQEKRYPLPTTIEKVKSGGIVGSKEQCVSIDLKGKDRIVIANTTVGTYLYVKIYLLVPFVNGTGNAAIVEPINDIFKMQQRSAVYGAAVDAVESAFAKLGLKACNRGYHKDND